MALRDRKHFAEGGEVGRRYRFEKGRESTGVGRGWLRRVWEVLGRAAQAAQVRERRLLDRVRPRRWWSTAGLVPALRV